LGGREQGADILTKGGAVIGKIGHSARVSASDPVCEAREIPYCADRGDAREFESGGGRQVPEFGGARKAQIL
jgi:hypothetical protein